MASFIFDPAKGETPETIAQRRKLSDALAARIFGRAPQNVGEGLSAIGQAWIAGTMRDEADAAQKAGQAGANDMFSRISGMITGAPAAPASPAMAAPAPSTNVAEVPANAVNSIDAMADLKPETAALLPKAQASIAGIESGGNYAALGPPTKGDRAYGKYQVMGNNIPQWTKEALGRSMTPEDFLANPDAQDAVFNHRFGQYAQKYGPEGASKAWFAGEGGMKNPNAKDVNGMTVANYGQKFAANMGDDGAIPPKAILNQGSTQPQQDGPDLQTLIQASTNPWLNDSQRAVVNTMLQHKLKQQEQENDPLRQLQIKKAQADLEYGKNPESVREYEYAKKNGYEGSFQDWIASKRAGAGEYGLNAIWGRGPDGKPAIIQLGKGGKPILTPMPEGFQPNKDAEKIDLGTHWGILDPTTRTMVSTIPKDLRGAEREKVVGEQQGKEVSAAPGDIRSGENALAVLDQIKSHEYIDRGTGFSSYGNMVRGTGGYDFENLVQGAKSGAFLTAIQQMRGLGSLSNAEGDAATRAISRMDTATSKEAFLKAVGDYEKIVRQGVERAKARLKSPSATNPTGAGGVVDQPSVDDLLKKYGAN